MKIPTYLPVFSGFYNTIFDGSNSFLEYELDCEESFRDNYPDLKDVPWDFIKENFWDVCRFQKAELGCVQYIVDSLSDIFYMGDDRIVLGCEFEKIISPKEYNFTNDAVDVIIDVDMEALKRFLDDHEDEFEKYLIRRYTSRDGFMSWCSNDIEEWKTITENFTKLDGHYLGSILDFYAEIYEIDNYTMYDDSNCHEGYSNGVEVDENELIEKYQESI